MQQLDFKLRDEDFARIAALVHRETGIALGDRKRDLVYSRLARRLRALQLESFAEYCTLLEGPRGSDEFGAMINAITTNLTSFFREKHHFDHLAETVLKPLVAAAAADVRRLRIWSAGCSSGEEPYSIAMVLTAALSGRANWDARILATDIDTDMVARASAGCYPSAAVEAVPSNYKLAYVSRNGDGEVKVKDEIRRLISFKPLNLLHTWPMRGPFDAIFCRNVAIYFDRDGKRMIFDRFAELIKPGGWLYIGHSESLNGISDRFQAAGRTVYRRIA